MKNTILNPAPLVNTDQKQGGKGLGLHSQHSQSQAGSLIFPTGQANASQPAYIKPSIQTSSHSNAAYHHHSSSILLRDYNPPAVQGQQPQMTDTQMSALSDIQQRIIQQNREMDKLTESMKRSEKEKAKVISTGPQIQMDQPANENGGFGGAGNLRRSNISETRRNQGGSNFRAAGEQAILRNSSTNNRNMPQNDTIQQDKPAANSMNKLSKPPVSSMPETGMNNQDQKKAVTLEPIENYKGKSVEELEAILDAYNAQKASTKVVQYDPAEEGQKQMKEEPVQSQALTQRRNRSQVTASKVEESKDAGQPAKNAITRRRSGVQRESRGQQRGPQGTRPPMIPTGKVQDKENIKENPHKAYGKVPKYLQKFNKDREDKEKQKLVDEENKKCPPGTRKMPEDERLKMLDELKETKKHIEGEIMKFPISMKTKAIQQKRDDLEAQLDKIENSIKVFSKEVVYVQV